MKNSTRPAAPLTPEPPKCCPACGAQSINTRGQLIAFICGQIMEPEYESNKWIASTASDCTCTRSFSAAVSLRAELTEAKRYAAHLEHENAALAVLHSNAVDERNAALARAEKAEGERDIHKSERMELARSLEFMMSQCDAARARLAELQAVCDAARLLYNALKWLRHLSFTDDRVVWPGEETRLLVDGAIAAYDAALASGAAVEEETK